MIIVIVGGKLFMQDHPAGLWQANVIQGLIRHPGPVQRFCVSVIGAGVCQMDIFHHTYGKGFGKLKHDPKCTLFPLLSHDLPVQGSVVFSFSCVTKEQLNDCKP